MTLLRKLTRALLVLSSVSLIGTAPARAQENSAPPKLTMTTIDVPGAAVTGVTGINKTGDLVGDYGQSTSGPISGFLYSSGTFTYFDYPGESVTVPEGINDSNLIVGYATQLPGKSDIVLGFIYDGATFTTLQDGTNTATYAWGINNVGTVVGGAGDIYATKGFEMVGGHYRTINFPGLYDYAYGNGINNHGEVVGSELEGIYEYGFVEKNGKFRPVQFPGDNFDTLALGINDKGMVVGAYNTGTAYTYAFATVSGKYVSFAYPGAKGTSASGVNASGQVVGTYTFDYQSYHGFVTSPITTADFEGAGCCQVAVVDGR